ncbi:PKD domain-containing protein [Streptomyces sp. NBC_00347]|uniref:PKD domain-containing protein n=1 Tax=Streptomyces sp. NBC_00347 TaxID=2975721 RepID=UPI00224D8110|nr:PKD domain-containing protein [Streptomyces sp. NBC_00347]MCX5124138.1 PKD domain-containing protein [Streptomyces sp. NBC_00347]
MRPSRATALLTAGVLAFLGVPAATAAGAPADLYVNNAADAHCSDGGPGSRAVPFCTISASEKVVKPGQTVRITSGTYDEAVTIDRSGEPGKPIAFVVEVAGGEQKARLAKDLKVEGASHVVMRGLSTSFMWANRATEVEFDRIEAHRLTVGEASAGVRLTRSDLDNVKVEGGSRDTVLARNRISASWGRPIRTTDAPGTIVTNNTLTFTCEAGVSLSGTSTGSQVFNNRIFLSSEPLCESTEVPIGLLVDRSATSGTRADYNLLLNRGNGRDLAPYNWAGTAYATAKAFQAATGQGGRDLRVTVPWENVAGDGLFGVDSGDPTAPGVLPYDYYGKPVTDDPRVANTGRGGGYIDRGAVETQDEMPRVRLQFDTWAAPVGAKVTATAVGESSWKTPLTYRFDFGDGTGPVDTTKPTAAHVFTSPCFCEVKLTAVSDTGLTSSTSEWIDVDPAGPLTADFIAGPVLPTVTDEVPPLTVFVDGSVGSTTPWPVTGVDIDFGDGTRVHRDRLWAERHTYRRPGAYKVTLTVHDSKGAQSEAVKTVRADYAASGYKALLPVRVVDTRTTGAPLQGGAPRPIAFKGRDVSIGGGETAVVVNVTVTDATEDTHLTVWPSGQPRPATSNVNVARGGTSSNTVTVPMGADGKIQAQLNSGKASLIVDLVGRYQPNTGERFSPLAPTRVLDTRTSGGALSAAKTRTVKVAGVNGIPADAKAVALNLTGTGATQPAHVIAYPDPAKRPATSNLNVEPGKDKSNQAIVPVGPNGTITLFTNSGSTHLVLDAVGYYGKDGKALFTPVVPKRLADTRTTGKVAPGATTTVSGLPADAVGAVLNVTATDSTGPGFLTAYAFGGTLPGASSLNTLPGTTVPNHVTTPVGAGGKVSIFNSHGGPNHVITDLLGYFTQG